MFTGAVELDKSYFGAVRKGKRGRGAVGKMVVFGVLKRGGKVFTKVVNDTKTTSLISLISRKIAPVTSIPERGVTHQLRHGIGNF